MRKLTFIVMALALVLGLTQCKKEQNPANNENKGVRITLKVENTGNRHEVVPGTGAVNFQNGDVIYVGNGSTYIGTLTRTDGLFSGDILPQTDGTEIYFYYVGVTPKIDAGEFAQGVTTVVTAGIENQSTKLPVLSYNHVTYHTGTSSYTCKLKNQCGLVKFVLTEPISTATPITIGNMRHSASINFATPGINVVPSFGEVTLYAESETVRWALLLQQEEVLNPTVTVSGYTATITRVPEITRNAYITGGDAVSISLTAAAAVGHALSVSVVGEVVGTDGLAYAVADKDNLSTGVTAAGMVAYKDGSNGMVIALTDEASTMDWSTAMGENEAAAHTPAVSG